MKELKIGDKAPKFEGLNQNGKMISSADFLGKKVVLYFYPKDATPTCTVEACNFRDNFKLLEKKGYKILGVSPDGVESHKRFAEKQKLTFDLIADEERKIIKAYGVWGLKKLYGREYEGVFRKTFIIDENGRLERIIEKVKSKEATVQVLGKSI